jgi:hypothetical protein
MDWHEAIVEAQEALSPHIESVGDHGPDAATPSASVIFQGPPGVLATKESMLCVAVPNVAHPAGGGGAWNVEVAGGTVQAATTNAVATPIRKADWLGGRFASRTA